MHAQLELAIQATPDWYAWVVHDTIRSTGPYGMGAKGSRILHVVKLGSPNSFFCGQRVGNNSYAPPRLEDDGTVHNPTPCMRCISKVIANTHPVLNKPRQKDILLEQHWKDLAKEWAIPEEEPLLDSVNTSVCLESSPTTKCETHTWDWIVGPTVQGCGHLTCTKCGRFLSLKK